MQTKTLPGGTNHKLPPDMHKLISGNKQILDMWLDITPLARNEWICWVTTCAKQETRDKHLVVMQDKMLKRGMRRPCCWVGCTHRTDKAMSATQKWVTAR